MRRSLSNVLILAILVALTWGILIVLQPTAYPRSLGYEQANEVDRETKASRADNGPPTILSACGIGKPDPSGNPSSRCEEAKQADERERSRADLIEQRRAADAAQQAVIVGRDQTKIGMAAIIVSLWTLGAAVFAALYARDAAEAAIKAFDADVTANRPIIQLGLAKIDRDGLEPLDTGGSDFNVAFNIQNFGATGCWTEKLNLTVAGNPIFTDADQVYNGNFDAFVGPGRDVSVLGENTFATLSGDDIDQFNRSMEIFVAGCCTYRDAGQRRWQTKFAYIVELDANTYESGRLTPLVGELHWSDDRLDQIGKRKQRRKN